MPAAPLPVTVLTGFLGAGKTTLVQQVLQQRPVARIAVIINDMSAQDVDVELVESGHLLRDEADALVNVQGGSASGERRMALVAALRELAAGNAYDHVLLETSGSAEPLVVARAVQEASTPDAPLHLHNLITLVDAYTFMKEYGLGEDLFKQIIANEEEGRWTVETLLVRQIQAANRLLLTKTDLVQDEALPIVERALRLITEAAPVHRVARGQVNAAQVIGEQGFTEAQLKRPMAGAELAQLEVDPEAFGLGSAVFTEQRPFHPQRLYDAVQQHLTRGVYRSKGFIWLASRADEVLLWNQAGNYVNLRKTAYWKAAIDQTHLTQEEKDHLNAALAHPTFGDRHHELTVIGVDEAREVFLDALADALCTDAEVAAWAQGRAFKDPWP